MIKTKNVFGNDKQTILYLTGDETIVGGNFGGTVGESSYLNNDLRIYGLSQSDVQSKFGEKSYLWGTSTSSGIGMSATTTSEYNLNKLDFNIEMWIYVNSATTAYSPFFVMFDGDDFSNNHIQVNAYPSHGIMYWYLYIKNNGNIVTEFLRQDENFDLKTWYYCSVSRKRNNDIKENYSIYVGNPSVSKNSHWLSGSTVGALTDYDWSSPSMYIGPNLLSVGGEVNPTNVYMDGIRVSKGNARMWADNLVDPKRTFPTPNRAY